MLLASELSDSFSDEVLSVGFGGVLTGILEAFLELAVCEVFGLVVVVAAWVLVLVDAVAVF